MRSEVGAAIDRRLAELIITKLRRERSLLKLMPTSWVFPIVAPAARRLRRSLLQAALIYINTLMIQDILAEPAWAGILTDEDKRGVNPLFTSNMTPYGEVKINMTSRLDLSDPTPPEPDLDALAA